LTVIASVLMWDNQTHMLTKQNRLIRDMTVSYEALVEQHIALAKRRKEVEVRLAHYEAAMDSTLNRWKGLDQ